jgi:hypothetical protein
MLSPVATATTNTRPRESRRGDRGGAGAFHRHRSMSSSCSRSPRNNHGRSRRHRSPSHRRRRRRRNNSSPSTSRERSVSRNQQGSGHASSSITRHTTPASTDDLPGHENGRTSQQIDFTRGRSTVRRGGRSARTRRTRAVADPERASHVELRVGEYNDDAEDVTQSRSKLSAVGKEARSELKVSALSIRYIA